VNATYLPMTDSACIAEHDWRALETACQKARMHPIQMLRFIAGVAGIPVCRLGRTSLTRKQYQEVIVWLEEYRRRRIEPPPPPADIEDDRPITEQALELLQQACRDLGLEQWQARQVIAGATGSPPIDLERDRLTERQFMQVFERLEDLEATKTQPPLSDPPQPLARPYPQWKDARETDKPRKKGSKNDQTRGIYYWLWEGL